MLEVTQEAREAAEKLRWNEGIPVRVIERNGVPIWSKVDDDYRDLTDENSDGRLYHVRSIFVPHGGNNPLEAFAAAEQRGMERAAEIAKTPWRKRTTSQTTLTNT